MHPALIVWQTVAHLCQAVSVATRRGLHEPRKFFPGIAAAMGMDTSDLAEALIVNVLRFGLNAELCQSFSSYQLIPGPAQLLRATPQFQNWFQISGLPSGCEAP